MKTFLVCAAFVLHALCAVAESNGLDALHEADVFRREIAAAFDDVHALSPMRLGERYTLTARGEKLTGRKDDFLRRRTAAEVRASRLTSGCGDNALVFIDRITARGFEALLIDSAEISFASLADHFSGHSVVAIRRAGAAGDLWCLIDPTARTVLSRAWSTQEKSFTTSGRLYWIGYVGNLENYRVGNPEALKRFYAETLATVPAEVLQRALVRFRFTVDRSLLGPNGKNLNPRTERLQELHDRILAKYRVETDREIPMQLTRGADDTTSELVFTPADGWVCRVGLKSGCSATLLDYLHRSIKPRAEPKSGRLPP